MEQIKNEVDDSFQKEEPLIEEIEGSLMKEKLLWFNSKAEISFYGSTCDVIRKFPKQKL
jgi:hypothetical protein